MRSEKIEVAVTLPRELWEELLWRAQTDQEHETDLLVRAIEQFLHQEINDQPVKQQLRRECDELAALEFEDVGTEEEWLVIQNEALHNAETTLG